jgi:hypothetical protein
MRARSLFFRLGEAGVAAVLGVVEILCPERPGVAAGASSSDCVGRTANGVVVRRTRFGSGVRPSGGSLTANGVVGTPAVVAPLRNGLARGRLGVGGLGFGLIDRERADRLAFLDHLESYGEGHTIAEDNVRKSNVAVMGLVLHPGGEAEGVRGDASDMFAEDAE